MAATPEVFQGLKSLRSTKYGRPFLGDTWDLFCSLLLSLQVGTRKQVFNTFYYAFTGNEALKSLASLKFVRSPDAQNRIATTTTAKISLGEDDPGTLMQHFLAGNMIKDAQRDDSLQLFREKGIYQVTMKGLRILEEWIEDNGIETEADHLIVVLSTLPMPRPKLWHLERNKDNDNIIINPFIIMDLFCRAVGRRPNYVYDSDAGLRLISMGTKNSLLKPLYLKGAEPFGWKVTLPETTHCFEVPKLLKHLCDYTTVVSLAEATEMAAHMVRLGLITLVVDKAKKKAFQIIKVNGYAPSGNPFVSEEGEFRYSMWAIYAITDEGSRLAGWPGINTPPSLAPVLPSSNSTGTPTQNSPTEPNLRSQALVDKIVNSMNGTRMTKFIKNDNIRSLFREYLRKESCAYLLSFLIDIEDLKNEFKYFKALTMVPEMPPVASSSRTPLELMPSQQHHGPLKNRPFLIYNTYLTPSSEYQLANWIGRTLQNELKTALEGMLETLTNRALVADIEPQEATLDSFQLKTLVEIYDRIQAQVFCILAVDFVPRFIKSPEFLDKHLQG